MALSDHLSQVTETIYRLELPVSFLPRHVNCYLVQGNSGWDLIDTGMPDTRHKEIWADACASLGIRPGDVRRIYVTHYHVDHYGLAYHLQAWLKAPVCLMDAELPSARRVGDGAVAFRAGLAQLYRQHGMPADLVDEIMASLGTPRQVGEIPTQVHLLKDGQQVQLGDSPYQVIWTPGHSDGQLCLYGLESHLIFTADHLLHAISPNVSLAPGGRPNPLGDYLAALGRVAALPTVLALPGHGEPFADLKARAEQLQAHHERRMERMLAAFTGPATGYAISRQVFAKATSLGSQRAALTETLAHLEYAVGLGRLTRTEGEPITYSPVAAK